MGRASNAAIAICDVIVGWTCSHNWLTFPFADLIREPGLPMLLNCNWVSHGISDTIYVIYADDIFVFFVSKIKPLAANFILISQYKANNFGKQRAI